MASMIGCTLFDWRVMTSSWRRSSELMGSVSLHAGIVARATASGAVVGLSVSRMTKPERWIVLLQFRRRPRRSRGSFPSREEAEAWVSAPPHVPFADRTDLVAEPGRQADAVVGNAEEPKAVGLLGGDPDARRC